MKAIKAIFNYDGENNYKGFSIGNSWNGFACPYFEFDVALQICKNINNNGMDESLAYYDATNNFFVIDGDNFKPIVIENNGISIIVFAIGAMSWTWEKSELSEFDVYFCYGGRYRGESKHHQIIKAYDKEKAEEIFENSYRFEDIYSIIEIN